MPLYYDIRNPRAIMIHAYILECMKDYPINENLHIVIGGDGFMLKTVRENYSKDAVFLGINCGRMGFLLNQIPSDLSLLNSSIKNNEFEEFTFSRIEMSIKNIEGKEIKELALNDIYLERMTGQSCHVMLEIDGVIVVDEMVCDGLIFCTALGSTAYSVSAGGAICHPTLPVIGITPICPHVPRLVPMIVPLHSKIDVRILRHEKRPVRSVADGVDFNWITHLSVYDSGSPVKIAFFKGHDFAGTLAQKFFFNNQSAPIF